MDDRLWQYSFANTICKNIKDECRFPLIHPHSASIAFAIARNSSRDPQKSYHNEDKDVGKNQQLGE
jgi:hypothetical protein